MGASIAAKCQRFPRTSRSARRSRPMSRRASTRSGSRAGIARWCSRSASRGCSDGLEASLIENLAPTLQSHEDARPHRRRGRLREHGRTSSAKWSARSCSVGSPTKLGRKKLFMVTLVLYLVATALSGLTPNYGAFLVFRFFAGTGHRRRVLGDQLRDRRARPCPHARPDRSRDQRQLLARRRWRRRHDAVALEPRRDPARDRLAPRFRRGCRARAS